MRRWWDALRDKDRVAFATTDIGRIFIACERCARVQPHYRAYPPLGSGETGLCGGCGHHQFRPIHLPEWQAAIWVLGIGWLWRKTIRREEFWDPRLPLRKVQP